MLTTLPNLLTISRIAVIPLVVACFYLPGDAPRWFACVLFSAAGITDWLDGHVARRLKQQSELGRFPRSDRRQAAGVGGAVHAGDLRAAERTRPSSRR